MLKFQSSHCVPLENLKVYNNANELLLMHYNSGSGSLPHQSFQNSPSQSAYLSSSPTTTAASNANGVQNVQKFVQSINTNFSKIFVSIG